MSDSVEGQYYTEKVLGDIKQILMREYTIVNETATSVETEEYGRITLKEIGDFWINVRPLDAIGDALVEEILALEHVQSVLYEKDIMKVKVKPVK